MDISKKILLLTVFLFSVSLISFAAPAAGKNVKEDKAKAAAKAAVEDDEDDEDEEDAKPAAKSAAKPAVKATPASKKAADDDEEDEDEEDTKPVAKPAAKPAVKAAPASKKAADDDEEDEDEEDAKPVAKPAAKPAAPAKAEVKPAPAKAEVKPAPAAAPAKTETKSAAVEKSAPVKAEISAAEQKKNDKIVEEALKAEEQEDDSEESSYSVWHAIAMYVPNRLIDLADCISLEFGVGADARFNLFFTQACAMGAGVGPYEMVGWSYHRQIGTYLENGWFARFIAVGEEDVIRFDTTGTVKPFWIETKGLPATTDNVYTSRSRDYWGIGIDIGALANIRIVLHPTSFVDFLCGIFTFDPQNDDCKSTGREDIF